MTRKTTIYYRILRPFLSLLFKLYYHPRIIHKEYIPTEGAAVIAGNHKHALDPILVDVCTRRVVHTLAKKELHDGHLGWFFRALRTIPVDLKAEHNKAALETSIECLKDGRLVNLSPEAKRNFTKAVLLPFKYGAVVMSQRGGCMLIPYSITGEYRFRSKNLTIEFGKPLDVSAMSVEEANALLYHSIEDLLLKHRTM